VAPLKPIPAVGEPFSQVIIGCVGPLPKSKVGNQFLLTIMLVSTRFPEAIPLRNTKAKTIIKLLIKFFTLVGLPKTVQSDQGSNPDLVWSSRTNFCPGPKFSLQALKYQYTLVRAEIIKGWLGSR